MIGISRLYCATVDPSEALRYGRGAKTPPHLLQFAADKRPVVVWNVTRRCNLSCRHCYSNSDCGSYEELSTAQAEEMISDLARYGSPVLLFSGGEPLLRPDLFHLIRYAKKAGMRAALSTNGTLITAQVASELKKCELSYVGVSLDGIESTNDSFRGVNGAFDAALNGIRNCRDAGVKVGLRFTLNKHNYTDVPSIFDLLEKENIPRVCFYHLVYSGRASSLSGDDLSHEQTRNIVNLIIDKTADFHFRNISKEVLTVDNHADGVYLYLRLRRENSPLAEPALKLLQLNGGNNSGVAIGCISWDGSVYADQFWRTRPLGNIRQRPFSSIWSDSAHPLLSPLRDRKLFLKGRCGSCVWKDICNGNFRARAEAVYNDIWAQDPACFLTDEEISVRV
ncbi:Radical SAM domain heme biosynthesis protein [Chitinispirillum alkaliphilum]|nr:Radical SAM domain heme biosynthesis protein [Chitinispirillum alkaliphilum]